MINKKKGAMEMSIGTIVTIALLMVVLVLGMYLIRTIMCSGIIITEDITDNVKNEVKGLFGVNDYGVKCMGEDGKQVTLGDGGPRQIICMIKEDDQTDYRLEVTEIKSLSGVSTDAVKDWIIDDDKWEESVPVGDTSATILILDIPRDTPNTLLKISIKETNKDTDSTKPHTSLIEIKHIGTVGSAIC